MIHNHEVPGSIPGLATEAEKVEKLSPLFVLYSCNSLVCPNFCPGNHFGGYFFVQKPKHSLSLVVTQKPIIGQVNPARVILTGFVLFINDF